MAINTSILFFNITKFHLQKTQTVGQGRVYSGMRLQLQFQPPRYRTNLSPPFPCLRPLAQIHHTIFRNMLGCQPNAVHVYALALQDVQMKRVCFG